jgi:hypothetical protein
MERDEDWRPPSTALLECILGEWDKAPVSWIFLLRHDSIRQSGVDSMGQRRSASVLMLAPSSAHLTSRSVPCDSAPSSDQFMTEPRDIDTDHPAHVGREGHLRLCHPGIAIIICYGVFPIRCTDNSIMHRDALDSTCNFLRLMRSCFPRLNP